MMNYSPSRDNFYVRQSDSNILQFMRPHGEGSVNNFGVNGVEGIGGGINLAGFNLQGRVTAAFLGAIVIAMAGFYIVTRGIQL